MRTASADREGNLWIGTNGEGLMRFKDRPIRMFTKADGLPNNISMTVLSKKGTGDIAATPVCNSDAG